MAKDVVVVVSCDNCGGQDKEVQEFPAINSKGKRVILDMHPKCHAEIYGPGLELADSKGQPVDKSKTTPNSKQPGYRPPSEGAERVCLVCPETRTSNTGILNHMQDEHGFPHSVPEIYGQVCPIDGDEFEGLLARHIGQVHKEHGHISRAFDWAKRNGDPHGVVAARIAEMEKVAHKAA
jgi:hypothetical protein